MLASLQQACVDFLNTQDYFNQDPSIPVLNEVLGDIEKQIEITIAQTGLAVVLKTPTAQKINTNIFPPYFSEILITARVMERPIVNRAATGVNQPALDVAEAVAYYLHHFTPTGITECLTAQKIEQVDIRGSLTYDVIFNLHAGFTQEPTRS